MVLPLFFGLVGLLAAIYIWIGKSASKDQESSDDYFLMGRKLTFVPLSLTLLATQLGGGTLMGASTEAYQRGWVVLLYPLGTCLGLCILGMGYGGKLRKLNISTVAEIFQKIYKSKEQRYIASGLSIAAMFCILIAQGIAARLFFVSLGVESPLIFITFWSVLVAYTVMGGLKAVVNTDILQALFILAGLAIAYFAIDFSGLSPSLVTGASKSIEISNVPWCAWLFMPLLFMLIEQDMGQRCFAAKNARVISFSAISAGIVLIVSSSVAIYFGVLARQQGLVIPENSSVLIEAVKVFTNPTVSTIFIVAIFMAIISTADSLLCSISSNLSCDFLSSKKLTEKKKVQVSQAITFVTGIVALGCAYLFNNVITILMISYELSVCVLFVPISFAIFLKSPSKLGAYLSMALGGFGFIAFRFIEVPIPREMAAIVISLVGYGIGQMLSRREALVEVAS